MTRASLETLPGGSGEQKNKLFGWIFAFKSGVGKKWGNGGPRGLARGKVGKLWVGARGKVGKSWGIVVRAASRGEKVGKSWVSGSQVGGRSSARI